jgi:hypothetical protein
MWRVEVRAGVRFGPGPTIRIDSAAAILIEDDARDLHFVE